MKEGGAMLKGRWVAAAVAVFILAQAPGMTEAKTPSLFKDRAAATALIQEDRGAALSKIDAYIAKYPKKGEGYYWRGYLEHQEGNNEQAALYLEKALQYDKDWPTLTLLLSIYTEEEDMGKLRATAKESVKYYKSHKKQVTGSPAEIASVYYWASEYEAGLKLFPGINSDGDLNSVRALMCLELALAERNKGSIYKAKAYATKGLQYDSGNEELKALDKELSAAIEADKTRTVHYSGHDHYYRYCYWERPYWFYMNFCWPHHFHHAPLPPPGGWRPGHMPPPPPPAHHPGSVPGGAPPPPPGSDVGPGPAQPPPDAKGAVMLPNLARGGAAGAPHLSSAPAPKINVPSLPKAGKNTVAPAPEAKKGASAPQVLLPDGWKGPAIAKRPGAKAPATEIVRGNKTAAPKSNGSVSTMPLPVGGNSAAIASKPAAVTSAPTAQRSTGNKTTPIVRRPTSSSTSSTFRRPAAANSRPSAQRPTSGTTSSTFRRPAAASSRPSVQRPTMSTRQATMKRSAPAVSRPTQSSATFRRSASGSAPRVSVPAQNTSRPRVSQSRSGAPRPSVQRAPARSSTISRHHEPSNFDNDRIRGSHGGHHRR